MQLKTSVNHQVNAAPPYFRCLGTIPSRPAALLHFRCLMGASTSYSTIWVSNTQFSFLNEVECRTEMSSLAAFTTFYSLLLDFLSSTKCSFLLDRNYSSALSLPIMQSFVLFFLLIPGRWKQLSRFLKHSSCL